VGAGFGGGLGGGILGFGLLSFVSIAKGKGGVGGVGGNTLAEVYAAFGWGCVVFW